MTPKEIVGFANLPTFRKHYKICSSATNDGEFPEKKLSNDFGSNDRAAIAETYRHLRENGYVPCGTTPDGKIKIMVVTKSKCQILMEKGMPGLLKCSQQQLMDMARKGYVSMVKSVDVPGLTDVKQAYR